MYDLRHLLVLTISLLIPISPCFTNNSLCVIIDFTKVKTDGINHMSFVYNVGYLVKKTYEVNLVQSTFVKPMLYFMSFSFDLHVFNYLFPYKLF